MNLIAVAVAAPKRKHWRNSPWLLVAVFNRRTRKHFLLSLGTRIQLTPGAMPLANLIHNRFGLINLFPLERGIHSAAGCEHNGNSAWSKFTEVNGIRYFQENEIIFEKSLYLNHSPPSQTLCASFDRITGKFSGINEPRIFFVITFRVEDHVITELLAINEFTEITVQCFARAGPFCHSLSLTYRSRNYVSATEQLSPKIQSKKIIQNFNRCCALCTSVL